MKLKRDHHPLCSMCGASIELHRFDIVNSEKNPELRDKLLDQTFFSIKCPVCGENNVIPYPLMYNDAKNKVMIYYDSYADLLELYETEVRNKTFKEEVLTELGDQVNKYNFFAAPTVSDLLTAIVCAESQLDFKVAWLTIYEISYDFVCSQEDEEFQSTNHIGLRYNEKDELEVWMDSGKEHRQIFTVPFSMKKYKSIFKKYFEELKGTHDFIFDEGTAEKFLEEQKCEQPKYNQMTKIGIIQLPLGPTLPLPLEFPQFVLAEESNVVIYNIEGFLSAGFLHKIIELPIKEVPFKIDKFGFVQCVGYEYMPSEKYDSNIVVDNRELEKYFAQYLKSKKTDHPFEFPDDALANAKVIIGVTEYDNAELVDDGEGHQWMEPSPDFDETRVDQIPMLNIYLSMKEAQRFACHTKTLIVDFVDALRLAKSLVLKYGGVVINPEKFKRKLYMSWDKINEFFPSTLMANRENMKKLLKKFTKEEIEYMSLDEYGDALEMIKNFYQEKKISPKELAKNFNIPFKKVDRLLCFGYERMRKIVICNYETVE